LILNSIITIFFADVLKSQQQKVAQIIEFNLEND